MGGLSWTGGPFFRRRGDPLAKQFLEAIQVRRWRERQCSVLAARPLITQHDYILFHILLALGTGHLRDSVARQVPVQQLDTLSTPIFARCPVAGTDACRVMLRTLAGMEDFARANGHYRRWGAHPTLRHSACERLCLHCVLNSPEHRLNSEWHAYMDCPLTEKARREFVLTTKLETFFQGTSSIESFALLIARIRDDTRLINAFARFSLQVQSIRKVWFRRLSSEAMKVELAERIAALDV